MGSLPITAFFMPPLLYLDYNATTPLDPAVRAAMVPYLEQEFGNPSSFYSLGRRAEAALTRAREQVGTLLGAQPSEIIFNSGATESITTAFMSALSADPNKRHIVTSAVEHSATLELCRDYEARGYEVTCLPVDRKGQLSLQALEEAITPATALVSLLWANNETGVLLPVEEIAVLTEKKGTSLHLDAVQAVGKIPINLHSLPVHYLSLSGHKLYAPKGVGALYVHRHVSYTPLLRGSQEGGRRGGTENVASIVALGEAAQLAQELLPLEITRQALLRDRLEQGLLNRLENVQCNGDPVCRLFNTSSLTFDGIQAAEALLLLDQEGLCCSAGSACNTQSQSPSHVLSAMGLSREEARSTLRFSVGRFTTEAEIESALEIVPRVVKKLRAID